MMLSLFGIVAIGSCIYTLSKYSSNLALLCRKAVELSIIAGIFLDVGYVIQLGSAEIEYNYLFGFFAFIVTLFYLLKWGRGINAGNVVLFTFFFVLLFGNLIIKNISGVTYFSESLMNKGSWENAVLYGVLDEIQVIGIRMSFIRIVILMITILGYSYVTTVKDIAVLCRKIRDIASIYAMILFAETILNNIFKRAILRNLVFSIFGYSSSSVLDGRILASGFITPIGLANEYSSLSFTCFISLVASLYAYKIYREKKWALYVIFAAMLLSMGMSSIMYTMAFVCLLFTAMTGKQKRYMIVAFPIILVLGYLVAFKLFGDRLGEVISNLSQFDSGVGLTYSSAVIRMYSIYNNFRYFLRYPLFGTGYSTVYSYSSLMTFFANFGIVGCVIFFKYMNICISRISNKRGNCIKIIPFMIFAFGFTGHLGHLLYYEKVFFVILVASMLVYKIIPEKVGHRKHIMLMEKYVYTKYGLDCIGSTGVI